jgi:hypothetical protein
MVTNSHYQRLGLTPAASTEEVRAAYHALAKRLHPDRVGNGSEAERTLAERRMREINEAWTVLRDPARRRAYDATLLGSSSRVGAGAGPAVMRGAAPLRPSPYAGTPRIVDEDDDGPEVGPLGTALAHHLPWVALLVVLGAIFIATAYASSDDEDPERVRLAVAGDCVNVGAGPTTTIVPCEGPHELRIVERVDEVGTCPPDTERRRLGTDGLLDCVATT